MRYLKQRPRMLFLMMIALALACYWGLELVIWLKHSNRVRIQFARTVAILSLLAIVFISLKRATGGRYRLATLIFVLPTIMAIAMTPLPYFVNAQSVRTQLTRTGVVYRIEATEFEEKLNWFAHAFLGERNLQLFSSRVVHISIDMQTFDSSQLEHLPAFRTAQLVMVGALCGADHIPRQVLEWLESLPKDCKVFLSLDSVSKVDLEMIAGIRRSVDILSFYNLSLDADHLHVIGQANVRRYQFRKVVFAGENWDSVAARPICESLDLLDCQVRPDQVLAIADKLKCQKISLRPVAAWSEDEIQRVRQLEHIKSMEIIP